MPVQTSAITTRAGKRIAPRQRRQARLRDTDGVRQGTRGSVRRTGAVVPLRYVTDSEPGIARVRCGSGFRYVTPDGRTVRDRKVLARIRALAVPPAWIDVWICATPAGHLQATGRDQRGRKQHRYHAEWMAARAEAKYSKLLDFSAALPAIRRRALRDLSRKGLSRRKVIAAVVQLLERTLIRVGNDEYARDNRSFGLSTILDRHVNVSGSTIRFRFTGKSGKRHDIRLSDRRLALIVRRCRDLPGSRLFRFVDEDGRTQDIRSEDVNRYLREVTGEEYSAKDFRTWAATVLAALALTGKPPGRTSAEKQRLMLGAIDEVAHALGNTRAICRKSYLHPAVPEAYLDGTLHRMAILNGKRCATGRVSLSHAEKMVVTLLTRHVRAGQSGSHAPRRPLYRKASDGSSR
jgi:DNA topoisomerase-1